MKKANRTLILVGGVSLLGWMASGMPAAAGKVFENNLVKLTVPDRWWVKDDSQMGMMMILPVAGNAEKAGVYLKFEGSKAFPWGGTPEQAIAEMIKNYNGTPAQKVAWNDRDYVQTSYVYGGSKQTMLVAKKDGVKITVTLEGADHAKSEAVKLILSTLEIK